MSKKSKAKKPPKNGAVWHLSSEEATLAKKPHYNAYICRSGPHGATKYDRTQQKRQWKKELNLEGARTRGPLPVMADMVRSPRIRIPQNART